MTRLRRTIVASALLLPLLALVGVVVTRYWLNAPLRQQQSAPAGTGLVDQQPLITAQKLASLASTADEQELAGQALRLADHEVDLEFASALRKATLYPAPLPPEVQTLAARVRNLDETVTAQEKEVSRLSRLLSGADPARKTALQEQLELQNAMLEVAQEDLDAARQELIRAGGDPRSVVQRLKDQHDSAKASAPALKPAPAGTTQQTLGPRTVLVQWRVWRELAQREQALDGARNEVQSRLKELALERQSVLQAGSESGGTAATKAGTSQPADVSSSVLAIFKEVAEQQRSLAELDRRTDDLKQLDAVYGRWYTIVNGLKQRHLMALLEGVCWTVFFLLLVIMADPLLRRILPRVMGPSRRQHTFRIVARFGLQALGLAVALLVVFGPPSQLAAVIAVCGAGLTVALKDFIVAFFGWFILMGGNGIRPGDWVEINGIAGEVLEVGLLHTVLLETGNWSDAGHPTGRKVTFVNSFAVEDHYFNFSTTGQWLWDQIEVPVPPGADPYPIAELVQKDVLEATRANVQLAEQEWQRAVPSHISRSFSAAPDIRIQPTTMGVDIIIRYITRAHERYDLRTRLFYRIVERLRSPQLQPPALQKVSARAS